MKVIIAGTRTIDDEKFVNSCIEKGADSLYFITEIITGGSRGVDALAEKWANKKRIPIHVCQAEWEKYGRKAGPIRNEQMAKKADALIAIWDGESHGTKNMIDTAKSHGLRVLIYKYAKQ